MISNYVFPVDVLTDDNTYYGVDHTSGPFICRINQVDFSVSILDAVVKFELIRLEGLNGDIHQSAASYRKDTGSSFRIIEVTSFTGTNSKLGNYYVSGNSPFTLNYSSPIESWTMSPEALFAFRAIRIDSETNVNVSANIHFDTL